ncbi:MAG: histidine phosphatase family protein [Deltaproteobacteria bacterium]|nr:histidine phosphatase family protein [Deltaproteobacteria bacterium]
MRRIVLLRHGETTGNSGSRYHGSSDPDLAPEGREQMHVAAAELCREKFDVVAASPMRRAWRSAWIVTDGRPVRLMGDFREIHFGRWEGMTREEIKASDPVLYEDWEKGAPGFEYPGGERRADFRARIECGLAQIGRTAGHSALIVGHKGVIRTICETLTGSKPPGDQPALGQSIELTREPDGTWFIGRRSSNP